MELSLGPQGGLRRRGRLSWVPILIAVAVLVSVMETQVSGQPGSATYQSGFLAVEGLGLLLTLSGAWRQRNRVGAVAPLLVAAIGCTFVGNVGYFVNADVFTVQQFPSWTDAMFLSTDALLVVVVLLVIRRQQAGRNTGALIDALIVTVGVAVLSWSFLISGVAHDSSATPAQRIVGVLYPMFDVLVVGVLMRLVVGTEARRGPIVYLAGAMISALIGDIGFSLAVFIGGGHVPVRLQNSCYLLFTLLVGLTLWHPQAGRLTLRDEARTERVGPARMTALTAGVMLAPVSLLLEKLTGRPDHAVAAAVGGIVLFGLALTRMWLLVQAVERQSEQLARQARTDSLTGLANRRTFDFEMDRAMAWSRSLEGTSAPLTAGILDLDHFKIYNDTHGHGAGDQLLRECATHWLDILQQIPLPPEHAGGRDGAPAVFLARYGGEEFAVLFRGISAESAADALRGALAVTPAGQTFSAGVAEWDGQQSPLELLNRADTLLYQAKAAGRARILADQHHRADALPSVG